MDSTESALLCVFHKMEVKNCKSDCHRVCKVALKELKRTFSHIEQLYISGRPEQASVYLENMSSRFDLSCDGCNDAIDYILLLLTLISTSFTQLKTLKKQSLPFDIKCRGENSNGPGDVITGFHRMLTEKDTILFITKSLCHSSKFVRYKASKLLLLYFEELPCILAGQLESIQLVIYECARSKSATVLGLLHNALRLLRRKLHRISLDYKRMMEGDASTQLMLLMILLGICNDVLAGKYCDPCDCLECKSPPCMVRIKVMYQAEKLRKHIMNANHGSKEHEASSGLFQQLKDLLEHLKCFLTMFSLDMRTLFAEVEPDDYGLFYNLKFLLLKLENDVNLTNSSNLLAMEILTHFIHNAHIVKHFDCMKSYGFGGSSIAAPFGNGFSSAREYTQPTKTLKLLVLILFKCILCTFSADDSSSSKAMMELGNRALKCISTMLESTCSRSADEPVPDKFCDCLVKVMMDDDDQLIRSVETLLCIYRKTSIHSNDNKFEYGKRRILNEDFPHSLFHCLLSEISFDHLVCIDWLISDETCFASVLYQYLDIIISDFNSFLQSLNCIDMLKNNGFPRSVTYLEEGDMEVAVEGKKAVNKSLSGDEFSLSYPLNHQQDDIAIQRDVKPTKTDVAVGILPMMPVALPSLVDYSSSDNDDDLGCDKCSTNSADTSDDGKHIEEKYDINIEKTLFLDCRAEHSSFKIMKDPLCKSCTAFEGKLEPSSCEEMKHLLLDHASPEHICSCGQKETAIISSTGAAEGHLSDQGNLGNCETVENFMDFLVRLRLKLERIEDNLLSAKDFKGLISQLNSIEGRYDSLATDE